MAGSEFPGVGDNENVPRSQTVHEFGAAAALGDGGTAGGCFSNDPARLDLEVCGLNFLNLVLGCLAGRGDASIGECTWHGC